MLTQLKYSYYAPKRTPAVDKKISFKATSPSSYSAQTGVINESLFKSFSAISGDLNALKFIKGLSDTITPMNTNGNRLIHEVVQSGYYETLKEMLLNPDRATKMLALQGAEGKTPLAIAPNNKMAMLMFNKGANAYAKDIHGAMAGENPVLPKEFRDRIKSVLDAKILDAKMQVETRAPKPNGVDIHVTQATNPILESPKSEIKTVEQKKSFFNAFSPRTADTAQVEQTKIKKTVTIPGTEKFTALDTQGVNGLDDIVGLDEIKKSLKAAIIQPLTDEKIMAELEKNHTSFPNSLLFVSPPGCGKTSLIKAVAAEAGLPAFEAATVEELGSMIKTVEKGFESTKQHALIFFRGIDNLYSNQHGSNGEMTNALERALDGAAKKGSIVVMSAQNTQDLPNSILSPGRIDKIFTFNSPDTIARTNFIQSYVKGKNLLNKISQTESIQKIADRTQGFSIAQIKHVLDESVRNVTTKNQNSIDADEVFERIKNFSKEKNIPEINEYNKTSMYDTFIRRYQPTEFDAKDFDSIAGLTNTKKKVEESILLPWKNAEKLRQKGLQLPVGGVFAGDPGTSKTYMAKGLARELKIPLFNLKMSEIGTAEMHEVSKRIGRLVDQLITKFDETREPSILLMDEIDHFQKGQSQAGAEEVNTLLQEVERGRGKILFLGTTNEIEALPDSLLRDGRMGIVIHFEHCDEASAKAIIKNMLTSKAEGKSFLENEVLLDKAAKKCAGMVPSSVSEIVNDSLTDMVLNDTKLEDAIDNAINIRKRKDIEEILSKNSKTAGHRLNVTENSTLQYDTTHCRTIMSDKDPKSLSNLGGMDEIKRVINDEIVDVYNPKNLKIMKENKLPIRKGFLLYGPSDCGKTTLVKAVANTMNIPLYEMDMGSVGSGIVHETVQKMEAFRSQLAYKFKMTAERSLLFMDEAQQMAMKTSGSMMSHSHNVEETNFLKKMILTAEQDGIIYAMATNDLNQIEPAIYENAERLMKVFIGPPDQQSRIGILTRLIEERPIAKELNNPKYVEEIASALEGKTIGKISNTLLTAIRDSIKTQDKLTMEKMMNIIKRLK